MFPIISHYSARPPVQMATPAHHKNYNNYNNVSFRGKLNIADPHRIFAYFQEISAIYRESGHNQEISNYLVKKFKSFGFQEVIQKPDGTVIAARNVNPEHTNARILQAHMDIVGISGDGNARKPIEMSIKDGWLYANDRTLGADNGIGLSEMLAIAEDPRYAKMPLQMIVTTDEETGMHGAMALKPEDFYGRYLINLDSESLGIVTKGCADGARYSVEETIKMVPLNRNGYEKISVSIADASGGHSAMVTADSLNPIKLLVSKFKDDKDIKVVSISGGERSNAVPRGAKIEFLVPAKKAPDTVASLNEYLANVQKTYGTTNPEMKCNVSSEAAPADIQYINSEFQSKMFHALDSLPVGVLTRYEDGLNKTSQNLAILSAGGEKFSLNVMGRSSDQAESDSLREKTSSILSNLFGKRISIDQYRPIWKPKDSSLLQSAAVKAYSDTSAGSKASVEVCHGGLETGLFAQKRDDLDMISIGPTIEAPHSVNERLKIDTVYPSYNWLTKILELLPKN